MLGTLCARFLIVMIKTVTHAVTPTSLYKWEHSGQVNWSKQQSWIWNQTGLITQLKHKLKDPFDGKKEKPLQWQAVGKTRHWSCLKAKTFLKASSQLEGSPRPGLLLGLFTATMTGSLIAPYQRTAPGWGDLAGQFSGNYSLITVIVKRWHFGLRIVLRNNHEKHVSSPISMLKNATAKLNTFCEFSKRKEK